MKELPFRKAFQDDICRQRAATLGMTIVILLGCFLMLEYSSGSSLEHLGSMQIGFMILNCLTLGVLWSVFLILCNRVWLSNLLCTVVCSIIAVINHYVLLFHAMPLSFLVIKNFKTAMNVAFSYDFSIDGVVVVLLVFSVVLIALSLLTRRISGTQHLSGYKVWIRNIILVFAGFICFYFGYFSDSPIKPQNTIGWLWSEAYHTYGYTACTVESFERSFNIIREPDGYSDTAVEAVEIENQNKETTQTPDIILILNESFYDLRQVTDLETDVPYLENIENLDNVLLGYAVAPNSGGGTNGTEYELLTSNSLWLLPGVTPFNSLDLSYANSIVSHLNALGYVTVGSHPAYADNYSRGLGYHALAFQEIHFWEDFWDLDFYYNRGYATDKSVYQNLIRWYGELTEDVPRFMYMLTIQNHGAWDKNEPEHDIVHVKRDFGENTQLANEFLTGIHFSDEAFKELTDYYSSIDRPVIICMMGDHSPTFAPAIMDHGYSAAEQSLQLRTVPLVVWSNYDLGETELGTMSINYVVPTLLDLAGVELSPYYSYLLQMKEQLPVVTAYGNYYDLEGNVYNYNEDAGEAYENLVDNYFYLEYNNIQPSRNQELFDPYS